MASIQALKTQHLIKRLLLTTFYLTLFHNTAYADATLVYFSEEGPQKIAVKNGKALIKTKDQNDLLFDAQTNTVTLIQHKQKSFSLVDEKALKSLSTQISGIQSAIASQLANLPSEQRAQLEAFLGAQLNQQAEKTPVSYSIKSAGTASHNTIQCSKSTILENGSPVGEICFASAKQVGLNEQDFNTFITLQKFMMNAVDIMQDSIGKMTQVKIPNFKSLDTNQVIVSGVFTDSQESKISLESVNLQAINTALVVPQGYIEKDITSLESLIK